MMELIPLMPTSIEQVAEIADHHARSGAFRDYLERLAPHTRRRHLADLALFSRYLTLVGIHRDAEEMHTDAKQWSGVTWGIVAGFVRWMVQEGYAMGSINVRLFTVRAYCRLASQAGAISADDYARIRLVRGYSPTHGRNVDKDREVTRRGEKKGVATSISKEQETLLKAQPDTPQGRRDALLMCLLLDHGLRCGEVAALSPTSVSLGIGEITFYREKVDKVQTHRLTKDTLLAAMRYLEVAHPTEGLLMGSRKGGTLAGAMRQRAITERVRELGERVGLSSLSAHDCRHYWATAAMRGGTDVKSLQDAGGWASPAMPLRYAESASIANQGVKLS